MARKSVSRSTIDWPVFFLQLAVAGLFILSGLVGIINYKSDMNEFARAVNSFFGQRNDFLAIFIPSVEMIAGAVLMIGAFFKIQGRAPFYAVLAILILWGLKMAWFYFFNGFAEPDVLHWLERIMPDCVVLGALWIISRRYS